MRVFASSLFRWLTVAACGFTRIHFRRDEAEFPMASQSACNLLERTFRGARAEDCASIDALRRFNDSVNLNNQYEIAFIRETHAPFAWRFPTKGRSTLASSRRARESSQEKNILAASRLAFWKRKRREKTSNGLAQWLAAIAPGAQT